MFEPITTTPTTITSANRPGTLKQRAKSTGMVLLSDRNRAALLLLDTNIATVPSTTATHLLPKCGHKRSKSYLPACYDSVLTATHHTLVASSWATEVAASTTMSLSSTGAPTAIMVTPLNTPSKRARSSFSGEGSNYQDPQLPPVLQTPPAVMVAPRPSICFPSPCDLPSGLLMPTLNDDTMDEARTVKLSFRRTASASSTATLSTFSSSSKRPPLFIEWSDDEIQEQEYSSCGESDEDGEVAAINRRNSQSNGPFLFLPLQQPPCDYYQYHPFLEVEEDDDQAEDENKSLLDVSLF